MGLTMGRCGELGVEVKVVMVARGWCRVRKWTWPLLLIILWSPTPYSNYQGPYIRASEVSLRVLNPKP